MGLAAVVFPGQGSQSVGMGRDIADTSDRGRAVYERASEVLGYDVGQVCFAGPADRLEKTDIQQPAIFVTSVAIWGAFLEAGGRREQFSWTGGLSLGEYTALYVAGALAFEDALRLVQRRGELMQEASTAAPSGMVSLIGADETKANALCDLVREGDVLAPANFNCPGQVVLSGSKAACQRALSAASEVGCRAIALPVAGAFHSAFMEPAAAGLSPVLQETSFTPPAMAVIANVNARRHEGPADIRDSLRRQVTHPVLWQRCVERMIGEGVDRFVEIGPGRVLTGLTRKIDRSVKGLNVSTAASINEAVAQLVSG